MEYGYGGIMDDVTAAEAYSMTAPACPGEARVSMLEALVHAVATVTAMAACAMCLVLGSRAALPVASLAMLLATTGMRLSGTGRHSARVRRFPGIAAVASVTAAFGIAPAVIAAWSAWTALPAWGIAAYPAILIGFGWACAVAYRMAWHEVIWAFHMNRSIVSLSRLATMPVIAVAVPAAGVVCSLSGIPQVFGGALTLLEGIWALLLSSSSFHSRRTPPAESAVPAAAVGFLLSIAFALM